MNKHAGYDLDSKFKLTGETGSYRYMAPEVFRHEPYNFKVCCYCVGWSNIQQRHPAVLLGSGCVKLSPYSVVTLRGCTQVDVYSFSMIAYQLFELCPPFAGMDPVDAARKAALAEERPPLMRLATKMPTMLVMHLAPP